MNYPAWREEVIQGSGNWLQRAFLKATLPASLRQPERQTSGFIQPMARPSWDQGFSGFFNPFFNISPSENLYLNEQLVALIPCINAAIDRITQLVGCPTVESENQAAAEDLMDWWENQVRVNRVQIGGGNWFASFVKAHLVYGRAHTEIIPTFRYTDIYALQLLHTRTIFARPKSSGYGVDWTQDMGLGQRMVLNPDLLLTAIHDCRDDNPNGNSLLYGMPFMAEILNKMMASLKETWERYGVPTYFVRYVPSKEISDPSGTNAQAVISSALTGLSSALLSKANGGTRDFGAAGDFDIQILGADGAQLDIEVPGRMILENLVAKTGLPPWMLGFHWSTTERLSAVQASLIGEQISETREHLESEIRYLFNLRQAFVGRPFEYELSWEAPSLIDQMETAQAEKAEQEARSAKLKVSERLWTLGILQDWEVAQAMRPELKGKSEADVRDAVPDLLALPPMPVSPFGGGGDQPPGEEQGGPPRPQSPFGRSKSITYEAELTSSSNGHRH